MRARLAVAALALAVGCTDDRHVRVLLGPTEDTLSDGFTCDGSNGQLLVTRALQADGSVRFNLVVDIIDLGGSFPSCLGEDVVATCRSTGHCALAIADAPTRFCQPVELASASFTTAAQAQTALLAYVHDHFDDVFQAAPHVPVIVRAVATTEDCAAITVPAGSDAGAWADLAGGDAVLGCAYSCPVDLDDAPAEISLGLDFQLGSGAAGAAVCDAAVSVCAGFPGNAGP